MHRKNKTMAKKKLEKTNSQLEALQIDSSFRIYRKCVQFNMQEIHKRRWGSLLRSLRPPSWRGLPTPPRRPMNLYRQN